MNFLIVSVALIASLLGESHGNWGENRPQWGMQPSQWPTQLKTRFTDINKLMAQQMPISNVHQVPCEDANSLTPTAAPVYDPCVEKAVQTSKVAHQNSHKVFNRASSNGHTFFFRQPTTIKIVHHEKPVAAPVIPDPCVDESVEIQKSTVNVENPKVSFTNDDINRIFSIINLYGSIMSSSTEQPKPTTVAPEVIVPCEDETHETHETTETKETSESAFSENDINRIVTGIISYHSKMNTPKPTTAAPEVIVPCEDETHKTQETSEVAISNDDINHMFGIINLFGSMMSPSTEQPKPTTVAPEVPVPCEDETHETHKTTNVIKTTKTTVAAAPTTKVSQSNGITAVSSELSGFLEDSQPTVSFQLKPTTTTTYTTTSTKYTPPKFNGGVQKEITTSHVQNSADCDETETASGGATSVDVTSSYPLPIPQIKVTESHDEKTAKSVPTSVSTTWEQYPVPSAVGPHAFEWHKNQETGSTYQKNSESHKYFVGAGVPQLAASEMTYPAASFNFEFSGQGNGAGQTKSTGVNANQLVGLSDGSVLSISKLMEILNKQKDC
ncbi:mucin-2-like [Microplitis mediator]|uniref:mucin-2-like n=1 Tax=Microplitis mediator TaxID=375433 RepID=UPI002555A9FD|nr:mucin-2-like [Microplitis mediator]